MEDCIMLKSYKFGIESIPVSGVIINDESALLVGSAKWENYRIILMKINSYGEDEWVKIYGGRNDWEAHFIKMTDDGYVISGAVEGVATPSGGSDWKGYLMGIDKEGNKMWDFKYSLFGNECVYSVLPISDGYFLFGITQNNRSYPFLVRINKRGEEIWHKVYDSGDTVGGMVPVNEGYLLTWSDWEKEIGFIAIVNEQSEILKKRIVENVVFINMFEFEDEIFIVGEKNHKAYLAKLSHDGEFIWERTYGKGIGITLAKTKNGYLFGGDIDMKPHLYKIGFDGELEETIYDLWEDGWIELILKMDDKYLIAGPVLMENSMHIGIDIIDCIDNYHY